MNRITVFFLGVITGIATLYISENFYVVRSEENWHLIPKIAAKLEIPYRDIREYTVDDWREDTSLALAIMKADKEELLVESGVNGLQNQLEGLLRTFTNE